VDEYRGKQVEEGKKSLTFRVWLGSDEGTLTSEQVEQTMERIAQKLRKKLGGELRG
jgi:phenylalanyl-tRNA synthetase beta chain